MRKLGNLTAHDLGKWVTIPAAPDENVTEHTGRLLSIEHHYGDGVLSGSGALTTVVAHPEGRKHPDVWTYVPDWPCTTEGVGSDE